MNRIILFQALEHKFQNHREIDNIKELDSMCDFIVIFIPNKISDESLYNKLLLAHFLNKVALLLDINMTQRFTDLTLLLDDFFFMLSNFIKFREL